MMGCMVGWPNTNTKGGTGGNDLEAAAEAASMGAAAATVDAGEDGGAPSCFAVDGREVHRPPFLHYW